MTFKILYIEDQDPGSILHDLTQAGFNIQHHDPGQFEELIRAVNGYDLLLIDFRLTGGKAIFDAPTIAQTLRTLKSMHHKDIPMVLISSEDNISDYYDDFSSHDLFDFSIAKSELVKHIDKYSKLFHSVINAYKAITANNWNADKILAISPKTKEKLDYRIIEKLTDVPFKDNVFAYSNFILNQIVRSIGVLIGEDVLSARLGVSRESPDWEALKKDLEEHKYKGIFSESYDRWWSSDIDDWWIAKTEGKSSLRRLNAEQRVDLLKEITGHEQLRVQEKIQYAVSNNFWTICKEKKIALDPIDGLELHQRDLLPWQEKEYLSVLAALESGPLKEFIKASDKQRLREIAKSLGR